jgi:hypothetical protein
MQSSARIWLVLVSLVLLQLSACCCFECKDECVPKLDPVVRGSATFVRRPDDNFTRFRLRGTYSSLGITSSSQIELKAIDIYGTSGTLNAASVAQPSYKLASIPVPTPEQFTWEIGSNSVPDAQLKWDGGPLYTLLVRYTYVVDGLASAPVTADWLKNLSGLTASPVRTFTTVSVHPGDTINQFRAHATFFGGQGQAFYDSQVSYTPPANSHPMLVELFAAPLNASMQYPPGFPRPQDLLLTDTLPAGATSPWEAHSLAGRYITGTDAYGMMVRVTYADNTTNLPISAAPESSYGTFTSILANLGHVEVLE